MVTGASRSPSSVESMRFAPSPRQNLAVRWASRSKARRRNSCRSRHGSRGGPIEAHSIEVDGRQQHLPEDHGVPRRSATTKPAKRAGSPRRGTSHSTPSIQSKHIRIVGTCPPESSALRSLMFAVFPLHPSSASAVGCGAGWLSPTPPGGTATEVEQGWAVPDRPRDGAHRRRAKSDP